MATPLDRGATPHAGLWTSVIAGAFVAAALSSILLSFGLGIGLSVTSTSPTWRDTSVALVLLSGFYLILQAVVSFSVGGYVAGRMYFGDGIWNASPDVSPEVIPVSTAPVGTARRMISTSFADTHQRDGFVGVLSWALAVLIGAFLLAAVAAFSGAARPAATSTAAARSTAEPLLSYELDRLYRSPRRSPSVDMSGSRAEAGRILLTTASHRGVSAEDRAYLISDVATVPGMTPPDAERRVDQVLGDARQTIRRGRHTGVILAFSSAAALLLGAMMAWMAGVAGGRHRDGEELPSWAS